MQHAAPATDQSPTPDDQVLTLRAPANRVSTKARTYWAVRAGVGWLALIGVQILFLIQHPSTREIRIVVLSVTVALALIHLIAMPQWRFRVHRWEATHSAVYTQSGWLTQKRRIAPMSRIQTVDTQRGPLLQLFKLANVTVTTASAAGALQIAGLDRDVADALSSELTLAASASADDAT